MRRKINRSKTNREQQLEGNFTLKKIKNKNKKSTNEENEEKRMSVYTLKKMINKYFST